MTVSIVLEALKASVDVAVKIIELLKSNQLDWAQSHIEVNLEVDRLAQALTDADVLTASEKARLDAAVPRR